MYINPIDKLYHNLKIICILFFIFALFIQNVAAISKSDEQNLIQDKEKYITVKKSFIPLNEFYKIGDEIRVCVEIKSEFKYVSELLDNVKIYEIIEKGLNVTNSSMDVFKISNVTSLIDYENSLLALHPIFFCSPKNCTSYIFNWYTISQAAINVGDSLGGQDRLLYWYNITPQRNGEFEIRTIVSADSYSDFEDTQSIKVRKEEPNLEVHPIVDKNSLLQYETVKIKYYVSFVNDSDLSKNWPISIELGDPTLKNDYFEVIEEPESKNPIINGSDIFTWKIAYPQVGKFRAPGVLINKRFYPSNEIITVESFFTKNYNILSELVLSLTIITLLIGIYIHFKTGSLRRQLKKFCMRYTLTSIIVSFFIIILSMFLIIAQKSSTLDSIDVYVMKYWNYITILIYVVILFFSLFSLKLISSSLKEMYLFSWTDIPGKDEDRLRELLIDRYHLDWAKNAKIIKTKDDKAIKISAPGKKTIEMKLNDEKKEVLFDNNTTIKFIAEKRNDKLNVYDGMTKLIPKIDINLLIAIVIILFSIIILSIT